MVWDCIINFVYQTFKRFRELKGIAGQFRTTVFDNKHFRKKICHVSRSSQ